MARKHKGLENKEIRGMDKKKGKRDLWNPRTEREGK